MTTTRPIPANPKSEAKIIGTNHQKGLAVHPRGVAVATATPLARSRNQRARARSHQASVGTIIFSSRLREVNMLIDASMRRPVGQKFSRTWIFQVLAVVLLLPHAAAAQTAGWFEAPPLVPAQVLAPASLVSGGGFRVDSPVPTDGLMALFTIRSNVGNFNAPGLEMLRIRVAELPAIVQLRQTSKTGVFAQSLAKNAVAPVQAAGEMLMNPADTVKGL